MKRVAELDGVRGLAAIAVVIYHYFYRYDELYGHDFTLSNFFELSYYGHFGVHLFFIVSGFVIYWTISRSTNPLDFIWSRFSRLYPPFWVALIVTFVALAVFSLPDREVDVSTFLLNSLMFHEYLGVKHVDGVYWTLTLELAFYFWVLVIFWTGNIQYIERILIVWMCCATILTLQYVDIQIIGRVRKFLLLDYIELFAAGICFYNYKSKTYTRLTHVVMTLSVMSLYFSYSVKTATALCVFYLLFMLITIDKAKFLKVKLLTYFGSISYALYLVHQNIGYIVIRKFYAQGLNPFLGILLAFALSILIASLIMFYIERPSLRVLRGFYKNNEKVHSLRDKFKKLT
ncbi:acyltransferase family protein [Alteromonas gilva]|uniref:Acyltransferase n=1 Tax=Alteromonas gilva TaxID=2987522 RepID=A0ABT5L1C2_9ALTE|nr:acyltransferase [Alteromonas gilva]MDC8830830.1 acyltransferase [Alteromonas gilva]